MSKRLGCALVVVVVLLAGMPGVASGLISTVSGQIIQISPPPSVVPGALQNATSMVAFNERQGVTLSAALPVDIVMAGTYDQASDLVNGSVPAGTRVDSHFLHSDRTATGTSLRVGTMTFPTQILGVIVTRPNLDFGDVGLGALQSSGAPTAYPTGVANRGLEFGGGSGGDIVVLPDLRTIQFSEQTTTGVDQARIITRHNSPPTASAGGPYAGVEGAPVTLAGTASDSDGDPISRAWTFTWTGDPGTVCSATGTTTLTPVVTCNDDALVTAKLTVNDGVNTAVVTNATLTVANAAPALGALTAPTTPVALGASISTSAAFTDAGTNDTHTAIVSWGDTTNSAATITETSGSGTASATHTYSARGLYTITMTLHDDDLGISTRTAQVLIDGPPTVDAGGPYDGVEGFSSNLVGTSVDPENDPLTTAWTFTPSGLDPGGVCTSTGDTTLLPSVTCTDDATVAVSLTASDNINAPVLSSTTLTVANEAPVLGALSASPGPTPTGSPVSVVAPFMDSGTNDTHSATVNWGDLTTSAAGITESGGSGALNASHAYASPGIYTITVLLTDDDLGTAVATTTVLVNSPPTVDATSDYTGPEGTPLSLEATASDLDGDPLAVSWAFSWTGDPGTLCSATGTSGLMPVLTCNDDAIVTAVVTVSDGINPAASDTTTVRVTNVAPVASALSATPNPAPEGSAIAVSVGFTDQGSHDTHVASISWGDASATPGTVAESSGSGSVAGTHTYAGSGTYHVVVTITDDNDGVATVATDVVVNGAPHIDAGGPYSGFEGTPVALSGTATDPEGGDLDIAWSFATTADPGTVCTPTGTATLTPTLTCTDDATVVATLTVKDTVNPPVVDTATISIGNRAPTVTPAAASDSLVATGATVSVGLTFGDAGINDTHTAIVNWGDSTTTSASVAESAGSGAVSAPHIYTSTGTFHITVTVTDDEGDSASSSTDITVNASPSVGAGGPYNGVEGAGVTLNGTATDPDADTLTTSWAYSIVTADPGTSCTLVGSSTLTPTLTCNDDATVSVTLNATDGVNAPVVSSATVTIDNAAPLVSTPVITPNPVALGTPISVSDAFTDPGSNDDHTGTINWGDATTSTGTVTETLGTGGTVTGGHTYAAPGTYTVKVTVNDKDGGTNFATRTIVVSAPPTAERGGPYSGTEGSPISLSGAASDPEHDPLGISWTFAVSASPGTTCSATGITTLTPSVTCTDNGTVTATLRVDDAINPVVIRTATITVSNAAPAISTFTVPAGSVSVGSPVAASAAFSDPGTHDTHSGTISWGDATSSGSVVSETAGAGTASGSHAYSAPGTYTVTITVLDDDGGSTTATRTVSVNGPPVVNAGGPYAGTEGTPITLAATASDPDGDPLGIGWTFAWTGGAGTACTATGTSTLTPAVTCNDDAVVTATLTVTAGSSAPVVRTATISVANVAPTAGALTVPISPIPVGGAANASLMFADVGRNDTHTATVSWGDSTTSTGSVTELLGSGSVTASHVYATTGTYLVSVTVQDDNGGSVTATASTYVVVYNRVDAFVTGGGWINSPSGAYTPNDPTDANLVGKANVGFVARYDNSNQPSGETEFQLKSGGINLHSIGYAWLVVVNGKTKAYYRGTGTVNGVAGYEFLASVIDGKPTHTDDTFRMKVWKTSTGAVVYDSQNGAAEDANATTPLSGGSIVIH